MKGTVKLSSLFVKGLRTFISSTQMAYLFVGELQTRGVNWKGEQMRNDILIRERIVQCWVLVQIFKERKSTDRRRKRKIISTRGKHPDTEGQKIFWMFPIVIEYSFLLIYFLPYFKLHCKINHFIQVSLSLLQRAYSSSITSLCCRYF